MATQPPGEEQVRQRLDSSITTLDDQRTENLKRSQLLQTNKDKALKNEQARLHKKYGADHPRVAKINDRLSYNQAVLPEMTSEIERSEIKVPEFDLNTWMVHGRVLNKEMTGVKGLKLALYDADGKVEKKLGYACTDERGYYAIRYRVEKDQKSVFDEKTDYFLTVLDGEGQICHKEEKPLQVVLGVTDYRLIVLGDVKCTPPPGWDDGDDDTEPEIGEWTVAGAIRYDDQKPGAGLAVSLISKQTENILAEATTGRDGAFKMILTTEKHPDVFKLKPELFVVVKDATGRQVYVHDKALQAKVGGAKKLKIRLMREG